MPRLFNLQQLQQQAQGRERGNESAREQNSYPGGGKRVGGESPRDGESAAAKMKDNAINKIYKITNNALGISLIVT